MGVRRLSKGRNRGKSGGADPDAAAISLILTKYYPSEYGGRPDTFADLLADITIKAVGDTRADGAAGDLTILNGIKDRYVSNSDDLQTLYTDVLNNNSEPMVTDGGSSRRRKRRRTKKTRSAKRSVKRSVKRSAKRRKARR